MSQTPTVGTVPTFTIADRLRKARELTGLGQGMFAKELGVSRNTVSNYENGSTAPKLPFLMAWALRTGVPLEWLREGTVAGDGDDPGPGTQTTPPQGRRRGRTELPRLDSNQQPSAYGLRAVA